MEWIMILLLSLVGLFLLVVEVFLIPGISLAGIAGLLCQTISVMLAYKYFSDLIGHVYLLSILLTNVVVLFIAFRAGFWEKFALKKHLMEKVNDEQLFSIQIGMKGETISVLKPVGKALLGGRKVEVSSSGEWIEKGEKVTVVGIEGKKIIVQKI
jgi:membrane-bound ClpP family serine protease